MAILPKEKSFFVINDNWKKTTRYSIILSDLELNIVILYKIQKENVMSREVLDDVMVKGACQGKADAVVNCQCNIESAPVRCEQAENCMFYSYYKCSKQWKRLA